MQAEARAYAAAVKPLGRVAESRQDFAAALHDAARPLIRRARARTELEVRMLDAVVVAELPGAGIDPDSKLGLFARERLGELAMLPWQAALFVGSIVTAPSIVSSNLSATKSGGASYTESFTVSANANRKLLAFFSKDTTIASISNVKWGGSGGVAMTEVLQINQTTTKIWVYELSAPASGTADLYWEAASTANHNVTLIEVKDADQSTLTAAERDSAAGTTSPIALSISAGGKCLFIDQAIGSGNADTITQGGDTTGFIHSNQADYTLAMSSYTTSDAAETVDSSWSGSSSRLAAAAVLIKPV